LATTIVLTGDDEKERVLSQLVSDSVRMVKIDEKNNTLTKKKADEVG
jgi:hypothetical protein